LWSWVSSWMGSGIYLEEIFILIYYIDYIKYKNKIL